MFSLVSAYSMCLINPNVRFLLFSKVLLFLGAAHSMLSNIEDSSLGLGPIPANSGAYAGLRNGANASIS